MTSSTNNLLDNSGSSDVWEVNAFTSVPGLQKDEELRAAIECKSCAATGRSGKAFVQGTKGAGKVVILAKAIRRVKTTVVRGSVWTSQI